MSKTETITIRGGLYDGRKAGVVRRYPDGRIYVSIQQWDAKPGLPREVAAVVDTDGRMVEKITPDRAVYA